MKNLSLKDVLLAVFCNCLFGSAVPMIKLGYNEFGITDDVYTKLLFAGVRFFLSGVLVLAFDWAANKKFPKIQKGNVGTVILVGVVMTFLQYIFNYIGVSNTAGARSTILVSTSAFMSVVFAHFFYRDDKITLRKTIGSVVGFCGVILACMTGEGFGGISFFGEGFVLISAFCFVVGSMFNKKATAKNTSFTVTAYNLLIGGALLILAGLSGYRADNKITLAGVLILLYLIMVSSVGFTLWSRLLQKYPVGQLGVYNFVIPVSGAVLSGVILKEKVLSIEYIAAFLLVSIGIITVNTARKHKE